MTARSQRDFTVRPSECHQEEYMAPIHDEAGGLESKEDEVGDAMQEADEGVQDQGKVIHIDTRPVWEKDWEQVRDKVEDLNVRMARHFEDNNDGGGWQPPMVASPTQPTKEEWRRHQLTHTPYAAWCRHCNSARVVRANHKNKQIRASLVPDTDRSTEGLVKISMDYMYLHDRVGRYSDVKWNPPYLVVVEHRQGRVWAYQTPNKGPNDESNWLPATLIQDWNDTGFKDVRIQLKIDQEPSIINLQSAVQALRPREVIPVNSPVGESEGNGRVENAIRRVQEKARVLRHQLEEGIKQGVEDSSPIMAWLVRWAAELFSKYSRGDDGVSPHERIHGEKCLTPLLPFGENVMYLPMKIPKGDKGDVAKKLGVWLEVLARTQETIIGTCHGVVKCRIVSRLSDEEKWGARQITGLRGTPWEPVPGKGDKRIPVAIDSQGSGVQVTDDQDEDQATREPVDDESEPIQFRGGPDKFHVSRKAIDKYRPTDGCPACTSISVRGLTSGRVDINHNDKCRKRIMNEMGSDPQYSRLVQRHEGNVGVVQTGDRDNCNDNNNNNNNISTRPPKENSRVSEQRGHLRNAIHAVNQKMSKEVCSVTNQLNRTMLQMMVSSMHVAKFYSPPRITNMANEMGLRGGWSMDITTQDTDGRAWDFIILEMRNRAARRIIQDKPLLLIGSLMCTIHTVANHVNHARMDPEVVQARFRYAWKHLEFAAKLYKMQLQGGGYFLHEHPESASSWHEKCMREPLEMENVVKVVGD